MLNSAMNNYVFVLFSSLWKFLTQRSPCFSFHSLAINSHSDQPQILPSPQPKKAPPPRKRQRRELSPVKRPSLEKATRSRPKPRSKPLRGFPLLPTTHTMDEMSQVPTKRNLSLALEGLAAATASRRRIVNPIVEPAEDGPLYVKLLQKTSLPIEDSEGRPLLGTEHGSNNNNINKPCKNVGFVKLSSLKSSTFVDARIAISEDLEMLCVAAPHKEWRFFVPGLGPVSTKQESNLGALYAFLRQTTMDRHLGDGTLLHPIKVFLIELDTTPATKAVSAPSSS